ncbi:MAG: PAS domain-containing sensor histidine kinase [Gemmatimonadaceae bacterium]
MSEPAERDANAQPIPVHTSEHATREAAAFARAQVTGQSSSEGDGLYRMLVESVLDYAIFALDPTGHVLSWNRGAERFKGYTADEIIGQYFGVFYGPEDRANGKPEWELEVATAEGRVEDEGWRVRKDGSRFWANVVITALRDDAGALVGFAKVTRDLTERRAAEDQAIATARRLAQSEEANQVKASFLAAMSHELRTPLNAISGYADLLITGIGGEVSEQQALYLGRIKSSQQHLLAIINDILNFSRIEAGQITYDIRVISVDAVVDAVLPMIEPQATAKGLRIERSRCDGADVRADRSKVEQILINLLSNAVKFTPSGGTLTVSCERRGVVVALHVTDTGIGIPTDELVAIFEPFVQVGRTLTSNQEGTGLGLAISSDLARAMKGRLVVESVEGSGSRFTLELPDARPASE